MAKTFYYDSEGLLEATINDGTFSGSSWSDSASMTNEGRLIDQSIATAVSDFNNADALKITFSSAKSVDFLAVYFSATETDNLSLYKEDTPNNYVAVKDFNTTFSAGWNVGEFVSASATNYHLASTSGDIANLTEFIIGSKLEFEFNPDVGIGEVNEFGTTINKSIGGVEYAILNHETKNSISLSFSSISETFKDDLQSMENSVQNYKKFIYSENGATGPFHYVRLDKPMQFKEVSSQRYSVNISLIEQLS
tara:strand:+ start:1624 stop:2376 length:753 start_codon:yes stop_codon:yes gene_type:complete